MSQSKRGGLSCILQTWILLIVQHHQAPAITVNPRHCLQQDIHRSRAAGLVHDQDSNHRTETNSYETRNKRELYPRLLYFDSRVQLVTWRINTEHQSTHRPHQLIDSAARSAATLYSIIFPSWEHDHHAPALSDPPQTYSPLFVSSKSLVQFRSSMRNITPATFCFSFVLMNLAGNGSHRKKAAEGIFNIVCTA